MQRTSRPISGALFHVLPGATVSGRGPRQRLSRAIPLLRENDAGPTDPTGLGPPEVRVGRGSDGDTRSIGRTGLLPVAHVDLEEAGRVFRVRKHGEAWFLAGAIWRPINEYSQEPGGVALLTTRTGPDLQRSLSLAPISVPTRYW